MQCNVNARMILLNYIYASFLNFHKLVLSTNEVLDLQKQPLVGTLQKYLY